MQSFPGLPLARALRAFFEALPAGAASSGAGGSFLARHSPELHGSRFNMWASAEQMGKHFQAAGFS